MPIVTREKTEDYYVAVCETCGREWRCINFDNEDSWSITEAVHDAVHRADWTATPDGRMYCNLHWHHSDEPLK